MKSAKDVSEQETRTQYMDFFYTARNAITELRTVQSDALLSGGQKALLIFFLSEKTIYSLDQTSFDRSMLHSLCDAEIQCPILLLNSRCSASFIFF